MPAPSCTVYSLEACKYWVWNGLEAPNCSCMGQDAVDQVTVDVRDAPAAEAKLTPTENRGHVMLCIRVYTGCITANPD